MQYAATLKPRADGKNFLAMDVSQPHNVVTVRCILGQGHTGPDLFSVADDLVKRARPA